MFQLKTKYRHKLLLSFALIFSVLSGFAQKTKQPVSSEYFTVEDYYKVQWGHADEFIDLWKKNHYPLLKKAQEKGDVISIVAARPRLHSGEETRWDFRVAVTFKNAALAFDEGLTAPYKNPLYPDQETFKKEEQHRFEILLAHWDIETAVEPLN